MANRYWVGGTSTWNSTAGSKWSLTSGGSGGETIPGQNDDVFFDANSGVNTITISGGAVSKSLNTNGFSGTIQGSSAIDIYGDFILGSFTTWDYTGAIKLRSQSTNNVIKPGDSSLGLVSLNNDLEIIGSSSSIFTLQAGLNSSKSLTLTSGIFDTNNKNITFKGFTCESSSPCSVILGSSTITCTDYIYSWTITNSLMTLDSGTSTIVLLMLASPPAIFYGGSLIYYNLTLFYSGTYTIMGNNTFNSISITSNTTCNFQENSLTTFIADQSLIGDSSGYITLSSRTPGTKYNFYKSSGVFYTRYINLGDSWASGGALFSALNFVDSGNNNGWNFFFPSSRPPSVKQKSFNSVVPSVKQKSFKSSFPSVKLQ